MKKKMGKHVNSANSLNPKPTFNVYN